MAGAWAKGVIWIDNIKIKGCVRLINSIILYLVSWGRENNRVYFIESYSP